jgi:DNA polymerase-3 subunit delta'
MRKAVDIGEETALRERRSFLERICSLSLGNITPLFAIAVELAGDKEKTLELLELFTAFQRDALLLQYGSTEIVNSDLLPLIEREAACFSGENIMGRIGHVAETRRAILSNVNLRLALEVLFIRLAERQLNS